MRERLPRRRSRLLVAALCVFAIAIALAGLLISLNQNRPRDVNDLWQLELSDHNLEGQTVLVSGVTVFEPLSDFRFNSFYLVDSSTPVELRTPENGFWFGIRIGGLSCEKAVSAGTTQCEPFDPTQAPAYEFKGTVHLAQVGKKQIMWLSDVDFALSRQLVGGKWQPIPLGRFIIPLK